MILCLFKFQCLLKPCIFNFLVHIVRQVKIWTINIFFTDLYRQAIFQWILHKNLRICYRVRYQNDSICCQELENLRICYRIKCQNDSLCYQELENLRICYRIRCQNDSLIL